VCLLKKSLYGLKQSLRQWYKRFDSFMIKVKYNRCEYDSYVYFKQNDGPTYFLLYVDDILIAVRNMTYVQKLKAQLKKEFVMKDLGDARRSYVWRSLETKAQANFDYPRRTMFSKCWRDST